jgi:hypothetical protein
MSAEVILRVIEGDNAGVEFAFAERTTCIIGRAADCYPRLVVREDPRLISRHHCLLDINPPDIRVRDFGSLNGTLVNGKIIGRRDKNLSAEEGAALTFHEWDLKDGDEIQIHNTVFRVSIYVPAVCGECAAEIPEGQEQVAEISPGAYQCQTCRQNSKTAVPSTSRRKTKRCANCGKDVGSEVGELRQGEFVCAACKSDPFAILKVMVNEANSGNRDLVGIAGYRVIRELGKGGFGAVYLAEHEKSRRQVALKVMLPEVAADERSKELFLREMRNTKALKHPHVVNLIDSGCSHGTFFCTLEYCDGGSVDKLFGTRERKALSLHEAVPIILQALDGLEYAHNAPIPEVRLADGRIVPGRGLVHRDLKPHNLFLHGSGSERVAKVADYGLAKAFDAAGLSGQTRSGAAVSGQKQIGEVAGTPVFMPRQQVIDYKYARPDVDVWAMAASLYNMLTNRYPRDFVRGKDVWLTVLTTDPVPIRKRDPAIPEKLAELLDWALDDAKELHYKTAVEFKKALIGAL